MLVATEQKLSPGEASGANLESHTLVLQVAYFKVSVNKFCLPNFTLLKINQVCRPHV